MTMCPVCGARFAAGAGAERAWLERHVMRSHGIQRMQLVAGWPVPGGTDDRRTSGAAA
ncbi:hypothetical protein [Tepidiforma sp.]|uniref:hypothetical protein n=1 Tax=Tepidiforma sp. TaxID=2682230 RepID=UPI002ADDC880|nr:hypothetical protein [Tepidiforma sp.]